MMYSMLSAQLVFDSDYQKILSIIYIPLRYTYEKVTTISSCPVIRIYHS